MWQPMLRCARDDPLYANSARKYDAFKSDIWSCGVILYTMLCGTLPFLDKNVNRLYEKILHTEPQIPPSVPTDAAELVRSLFNKNPKSRPSISEIRSHPFFTEELDYVKKKGLGPQHSCIRVCKVRGKLRFVDTTNKIKPTNS